MEQEDEMVEEAVEEVAEEVVVEGEVTTTVEEVTVVEVEVQEEE